jgi:peptidyl-prolyl cis-trans isomerase C
MKPGRVRKGVAILGCLAAFWAIMVDVAGAEVVARVNGVAITRAELDTALGRLERQMAALGRVHTDDESGLLRQQALDALIGRRLAFLESRDKGIRVPVKEIDAYMERLQAQYADEAEFLEDMGRMGLTEAEIRYRVGQDLAVRRLMDASVAARVTVTDEAVSAFYQLHADRFVKPPQVRARHILIKALPGDKAAKKRRARNRAETIRKRLVRGEDFASLAIDYSEGPSNVRGGDLGYFVRRQMAKPFSDAAFSLEPGVIGEVVETRFGYHVIEVLDRKPESQIPFESIKDRLGQRLRQKKINREIEAYVDTLRAKARIERY